ncbi:MAG: hypothetical protein A2528_03760 [Candidatus Staskawiczbacteria bacterium RIFOXYD2_FULL_37_9]|uniref:Uncharacterized protein n=1 Tax=Candidatus Staskawiczbacteria bacterium RIFOXYB1_FULL_37_44 TaxID=1802223 RepID=A0A1G2IX14_9BACT|nr:MAG: hypothetical protein A2358_00305 [Candidatus Staskawiczbacteria bacterium RIFOXYB1_FULL_37_44]OGZ83680.1 MAG: hypothetical protein A2416_03705 [Candidatus Staskawiczbacteria bacterium RIFOXYC1_FULL_37_52]OGZ90204.1 MAG: hypothetical protein A2581_02235 [Candidatus Staskawiczbacteria bacterium RIFOXYD1_FULL_37_110]OGZ94851.1 MAG: hypothetical protein A2528_03760 [Candidatus Staskawiczbacteria bacterium RIFOXYD2_FULL_37_9]
MSEASKHPLEGLCPSDIQAFADWKSRWDGTPVLGEKLGLLHCLQVMKYWPDTRKQTVFFLLDIANGYRTGKPFHNWQGYNASEINEGLDMISKKAFDVLCVRLFAPTKNDYPSQWKWMLVTQETFEKLLQFCLPEAENYRLPYDGEQVSHQTEVFGRFLLEFSQLGWVHDFSPSEFSRNKDVNLAEIRARLIAARPQFMEILRYIRQLSRLNKPMRDFSNEFPELDGACLKKLKEMAFRASLNLPWQEVGATAYFRKPETLHEAILGGSVAAEILVINSIRQKEKKRIHALYEESLHRRHELDRQQELERIRKAQAILEQQAAKLAANAAD